jgi:hypothetical protein
MSTADTEVQFAFDPFSPEVMDDPYPSYRLMLDRYPLYRNEERGFWTLARYEDIQGAARNSTLFSHWEGVDLDFMGKLVFGPGDFLDSDRPRHDQLRNVVQKRFTPKAIALLEPKVRTLTEELLVPIKERGEGDMVSEFALQIPLTMICDLLGFPREDHTMLWELNLAALKRIPGDPQIPQEALNAASRLRGYFLEAAEQRRLAPRDDVLSVMVTSDAGGRKLHPVEVVGMCYLLFSAGLDTTLSFISNSLWLLAQHPEQREMLRQQPEGISQAVEELLRFESPVQNNTRTTSEDVDLHGQTIPAGARVVLLFGAANRDPRRWENPDVLDITREPKRHQAFGEGIHFCLGQPLARMEGRIALETVLREMPDYTVQGPVRRLPRHNLRILAELKATTQPGR